VPSFWYRAHSSRITVSTLRAPPEILLISRSSTIAISIPFV
jgi:hypothetical protein